MTDHHFPMTPDSKPTHNLSAQGMIYEVTYFFENEDGNGGSFTAVGMKHDIEKPSEWILENKATGFKHRISIAGLEDATNISSSSAPVPPKTSCSFVYMGTVRE